MSMTKEEKKKILLDHYKNPRNKVKEPFSDATAVERGQNPQCGDEVEVGIYVEETQLEKVRFRGRGCSICIASASIMTEALSGKSLKEAQEICQTTTTWLNDPKNPDKAAANSVPELEVVMDVPQRKKCAKLSWEAAENALKSL